MAVLGYTAGDLSAWNAARAAVLAGTTPCKIMIGPGESTAVGFNRKPPTWVNNYGAWESRLSTKLAKKFNGRGLRARHDILFGSHNVGSGNAFADYAPNNYRGGDLKSVACGDANRSDAWANSATQWLSPLTQGGKYLGNTSGFTWSSHGSKPIEWVSDRPFTHIIVYDWNEVNTLAYTVSVADEFNNSNPSGTLATVTQNGLGAFRRTVVDCGGVQRAGRVVRLTPTVLGTDFQHRIGGIELYNASTPEVGIFTAAADGNELATFISSSDTGFTTGGTSGIYGTGKAAVSNGGITLSLPVLQPKLVIPYIMINDLLNGVTLADYTARYNWMTSRIAAYGASCLHIVVHNLGTQYPAGTPTPNLSSLANFQAAIRSVASSYGHGYLDLPVRWGAYGTPDSSAALGNGTEVFGRFGTNGWMADGVHPTEDGTDDIAQAIAEILMPSSVVASNDGVGGRVVWRRAIVR